MLNRFTLINLLLYPLFWKDSISPLPISVFHARAYMAVSSGLVVYDVLFGVLGIYTENVEIITSVNRFLVY